MKNERISVKIVALYELLSLKKKKKRGTDGLFLMIWKNQRNLTLKLYNTIWCTLYYNYETQQNA